LAAKGRWGFEKAKAGPGKKGGRAIFEKGFFDFLGLGLNPLFFLEFFVSKKKKGLGGTRGGGLGF